MKKYLSLGLFLIMILGILGFDSVFAESQGENEKVEPLKKYYEFNYSIGPSIHYNPIEGWRLGGSVVMNGIFGSDHFDLFSEYSFCASRINYGLLYLYILGPNYVYSNIYDNMGHQGIYNKKSFFQRERFISLGVTNEGYGSNGFYISDFMIKYLERYPANEPGGYVFDSGTDLAICPSFFGTYKGYTGKLDMVYSLATEISDYHYFKVDALVKKSFEITSKDHIVFAAEAGFIRGNYPNQQQFYLGSSKYNYFPNYKEKFMANLANTSKNPYNFPFVYLDGYEDNAFMGDKMYVIKLEYLREFFKLPQDFGIDIGLFGKFFTVVGNAWEGELSEGFGDPKTTLGLGVLVKSGYYNDFFFGFNLARGIGDKGAVTFGLELGTDLQWVNLLSKGE